MDGFKNQIHKRAFIELLQQAEVLGQGEYDLHILSKIEKGSFVARQIAFFYLIAMYQEELEHHEGMKFYVEVYEEISLDGPIYLLEDCIGMPRYEYEWNIQFAKKILKNETINLEQVPSNMRKFVEIAISICDCV